MVTHTFSTPVRNTETLSNVGKHPQITLTALTSALQAGDASHHKTGKVRATQKDRNFLRFPFCRNIKNDSINRNPNRTQLSEQMSLSVASTDDYHEFAGL